MKLNAYLMFNGNCEAAFNFYAEVLDGKITAMMKAGDTPMADQLPPDRRNTIMHAAIESKAGVLMGSDDMPDSYSGVKGMAVAMHFDAPDEAERVFQALAKGGTIRMPIQETFWAVRFGMLTDQFGIPWMINCPRSA
jgi:PhnB protein